MKRGGVTMEVPERACAWQFSRAGGPGGQGVNTADSRVQLSVDLALLDVDEDDLTRLVEKLGPVLVVTASSTRSQLENRKDALERARVRIEAALVVEKPRRKTRTPKWVNEKRLREKKRTSERKSWRSDT
jgi:ribosome-associated protein